MAKIYPSNCPGGNISRKYGFSASEEKNFGKVRFWVASLFFDNTKIKFACYEDFWR